MGPNDGLAGNHAAGDGNLNYAKNDRFSTPFRVITDLEYKKGRFGALVRAKYWYDQALNQEEVLVGSQANNFNGIRPGLGPIPRLHPLPVSAPPGAACLPVSPPGQNLFPTAKLSDRGFEAEQQFENFYLLDAYVYGSFAVGETDLQLRLGNQVINWGESIFIQGVNQINPIDVPAARRAGAELKEILLPVWAAYANWGFDFGSIEAFYQLQWNNTSVDACGTYFSATSTLIGADPGSCNSITVVGGQLGNPAAWHGVADRPAAGFAALPAGDHRHLRPGHPGPRAERLRPVRHRLPLPGREDRHGNRPVRHEHPQPPAGRGELHRHQPERPGRARRCAVRC